MVKSCADKSFIENASNFLKILHFATTTKQNKCQCKKKVNYCRKVTLENGSLHTWHLIQSISKKEDCMDDINNDEEPDNEAVKQREKQSEEYNEYT